MRLIDADALWKSFGDHVNGITSLDVIYETINAAPTSDAVPVVHAKWEVESTKHGDRLCCCRCGFCGDGTGENYCPYCGAKMDAEEVAVK